MTRFARAKGSKASNERVPEKATAWSIMKQQLLERNKDLQDSMKRQEIIKQRNANYKAFLEESASEKYKNTKWADFSDGQITKAPRRPVRSDENESEDETFMELKQKVDRALNKSDKNNSVEKVEEPTNIEFSQVKKVKKSKMAKPKASNDTENVCENNNEISVSDEKSPHLKIKNGLKRKKNANEQVIDKSSKKKGNDSLNAMKKIMKENLIEEEVEKIVKKKLKKMKTLTATDTENIAENSNEISLQPQAITKKGVNRKKNSKERAVIKGSEKKAIDSQNSEKKIVKENLSEEEIKKIEKKKAKKLKQLERRRKKRADLKLQKEQATSESNNVEDTANQAVEAPAITQQTKHRNNVQKTKSEFPGKKNVKAKVRDDKEHIRKKPLLPHKMFINGKELEIDYVEGFPVKKEDAERLKKLRKEMINKGLPRSEINIALKLERRKAEKAFAREKKKVCFNCRKSGHNLSECPELNRDQVAPTMGGGICFKCGSTEHTHFECKVVRDQKFNYAQCFVCNEQGHIARQCPDNPKGLYPKGGACKVCGDVTHLKKDCPKYQSQQQQQADNITAEIFGNHNPDDLGDDNSTPTQIVNKRPNKVIKF